MEDEDINTTEDTSSNSGDGNCPRCGLRTYEEVCPVCQTPLAIKKDEKEEEDEYYERRRERR